MKNAYQFVLIVFACISFSYVQAKSSVFDSLLPAPQKVRLLELPGLDPQTVYPKIDDGILHTSIDNKIMHREGYILSIQKGKVNIKAKTNAGLIYAQQTLIQLAQDAIERKEDVPACEIIDFPSTDYRAIHIDLKHHLDKKEYMYQVLRRMAYYKLNAAIVEFEDKIAYQAYPEIGAKNAPSIEEWRDWANYAQELNIDISPLIQGVAHADYILKHPSMKSLRENPESDWVCCPSNEKYYDVQFALYKDAIRATPYGKYLHVGGDEVDNLGICSICKPLHKTALEHQLNWLKRVSDFARAHGRIPIFWDDMVFKHVGLYEVILDLEKPEKMDTIWSAKLPELQKHIESFPKDVIYMRWQYGDANLKGNKMALKWYNDNGLKVMGATAAQTTDAMMPLGDKEKNIKSFQLAHLETPVLGVLCTAWDDASPLFETYWKGFIAHAQYGWNINFSIDSNQFDKRYRTREFGLAAGELPDFRELLERTFPLWETGLLDKGFRKGMWRTHGKYTLISLPTQEKGAWSKAYAERIKEAQLNLINYLDLKKVLLEYRHKATRNNYSLKVYECINELTGYTSKLLLALSEYDIKRDETSLNNLRSCMQMFKTVRQNMETVYAEIRYMGQPEGYILPMNHHSHLAIQTANTDWMFLFELNFLKKLDDSLNL